MIDLSAPKYDRKSFAEMSFRKVFIISAVIHVLVLIGLPVMSKWLVKPKKVTPAATFQLVPLPPSPPQRKTPPKQEQKPDPPPPDPAPPKPDPIPDPTPVPKPPEPTPAKPVEQPKPAPPKEEDKLDDDLAALLNTPPAVQVSAPGQPAHPYLRAVSEKIKRNWKPSKRSETLSAEVTFTIHSDGSVTGIRISRSSGDSGIDRAALDAVERCGAFAKLPHNFGDKIEINCTLRPTEGF